MYTVKYFVLMLVIFQVDRLSVSIGSLTFAKNPITLQECETVSELLDMVEYRLWASNLCRLILPIYIFE